MKWSLFRVKVNFEVPELCIFRQDWEQKVHPGPPAGNGPTPTRDYGTVLC